MREILPYGLQLAALPLATRRPFLVQRHFFDSRATVTSNGLHSHDSDETEL